jgi:hypothetical protein
VGVTSTQGGLQTKDREAQVRRLKIIEHISLDGVIQLICGPNAPRRP